MRRIVAILFGILCTNLAIAQNQPLACQGDAAAGLKWQDGRWQTKTFLTEKFILAKSGDGLTIESVAKVLSSPEAFVNCRSSVIGIVCSSTLGSFMHFHPRTLKGGFAFLFGTVQSAQAKDSVTVEAFSCTPF